MPSLPDPVQYSIESTQVEGRKPVIYTYERDIPTKIRPHYRHRLVVTGDPAVTTIGKESPCPCQTYFESMPTTHFATEELEKEFWSKLHHMMPQRDAEEEMDSRKWQRRQRRAQKSAAKKGRTKGKGSAQKTLTDSSDSDDRRDRETRQQRSGGGTAVESVAERAESDRKRREDEPPVASPQKIRGWILESGKPA